MNVRKNQYGHTALIVVLGVIVLAVVGFAGYTVVKHHNKTNKNGTSQTASGQQSTTLSSGTDDNSLDSDMNSINSSANQESNESNTVTSGLNDQQISVPTN